MRSKPKSRNRLYPCSIPDCWKTVAVEHTLCTACRSWWYRISIKSHEELSTYIQKIKRYGGRLGRIGGLRKAA